jgi:hypothetical protein
VIGVVSLCAQVRGLFHADQAAVITVVDRLRKPRARDAKLILGR